MARWRRAQTALGPTDEERDRALQGARIMTGYLLCAEVDNTRREAVKTMSPAELRAVVREEKDGNFPGWFAESILEDLEVFEGKRGLDRG